jgi:hypothetical protein
MTLDLITLPEAELAPRAVVKWTSLVSLKTGFLDSGMITLRDFYLPDFEAPKPVSLRPMMRWGEVCEISSSSRFAKCCTISSHKQIELFYNS